MARKTVTQLSFADIVMGAEADLIKQAYEARLKIDDQLAIREEAYRKIAEVEEQVEEILGEEGTFAFPAPPMPVAGINKPAPASRPMRPKPKPQPKPAEATTPTSETAEKVATADSTTQTPVNPNVSKPADESGKSQH